jgi:hypothetical protein
MVEGISFEEFKTFLKTEIRTAVQFVADNQDQQLNTGDTTQQLYTRKETAAKLKISLPTLGLFSKEGKIKAHRIGTRVRYTGQSIQDALTEMKSIKYRRR